jgi:hypothetical protein
MSYNDEKLPLAGNADIAANAGYHGQAAPQITVINNAKPDNYMGMLATAPLILSLLLHWSPNNSCIWCLYHLCAMTLDGTEE